MASDCATCQDGAGNGVASAAAPRWRHCFGILPFPVISLCLLLSPKRLIVSGSERHKRSSGEWKSGADSCSCTNSGWRGGFRRPVRVFGGIQTALAARG
jgi:hypothetical protein